eukprot:Plantae.Rhodophyta-Hildenbrandia_rubra.ctg4126.p1 GENE.Plantae.Rhodophyta-Hildenbrandia_rubra.ctg4126~~Plantae.Rhodophyta-Hildenbrandia_rubra.ctg4126.p1  ORF type:complete len:630 (-),score=68.02 Plantae.Rhodophyta-Hildenbrandia_rubra.ctg4126:3128-5017(-)
MLVALTKAPEKGSPPLVPDSSLPQAIDNGSSVGTKEYPDEKVEKEQADSNQVWKDIEGPTASCLSAAQDVSLVSETDGANGHIDSHIIHSSPISNQEEDKQEFASNRETTMYHNRRCISEGADLYEKLRDVSMEVLRNGTDSNFGTPDESREQAVLSNVDQNLHPGAMGIREYCYFLLGKARESGWHDENNIEDAWSIATKRKGVYNLVQVPMRLERLLLLGTLVCADEFLHLFTFLPLRCIVAVLKHPFILCSRLFRDQLEEQKTERERRLMHESVGTAVDFTQLSILVIASLILNTFDISWIYHNIRGQSVIKIYVVFNVMEIFDRLCCSLGVDVLDSLGWTTTSAVQYWNRRRSRRRRRGKTNHSEKALRGFVLSTRVLLDYSFTLMYTSLHAVLLLTWVVALNVAINTQNNALITLLVSNNFVELKGAVFKNYKVQNLFQISCSDAVERFQHGVFLVVMLAYTYGDQRLFMVWGIMYLCEILVDWIKHAFVTKFNRIHHRAYQQFSLVICNDIMQRRKDSVIRSIGGSAVSKRVGFISLPLGALVIRMVSGTMLRTSLLVSMLLFLIMCALKVTLGICLIGYASRRVAGFKRNGRDWKIDEDEATSDNWYDLLAKVGRYDHVPKH